MYTQLTSPFGIPLLSLTCLSIMAQKLGFCMGTSCCVFSALAGLLVLTVNGGGLARSRIKRTHRGCGGRSLSSTPTPIPALPLPNTPFSVKFLLFLSHSSPLILFSSSLSYYSPLLLPFSLSLFSLCSLLFTPPHLNLSPAPTISLCCSFLLHISSFLSPLPFLAHCQ